ncbi:hypothetical protein [Roseobacter sp.]|uniref:hypothetical protein n=1 Tax=Roseobacter sp. TaxID=1907202 RepID=UPI00385AB768
MPLIRTYVDIDQLRSLTTAEQKLLDHCKSGDGCILEDGNLPNANTPERHIRANLLRYLILGGCKDFPANGWGVNLIGAYISRALDLSFETARKATGLSHCQFAKPIRALQTKFDALSLDGSALPALNAQGINVTGSVFLRNSTATGEIRLSSARIGGQLDCTGATFSATNGFALSLQKAEIREGLIWRNASLPKGILHLSSAHVGDLVDDLASWPDAGRLVLDGFTYDRISAAPTDAAPRLKWLAKGDTWAGEFFPQPYTQLAKVLREMGHNSDASAVLAEREKLLYRDRFETTWVLNNGDPADGIIITQKNYLTILWYYLLAWVVGYGYYPQRSVITLAVLWLTATAIGFMAWEEGSFAPNSDPILLSAEWQDFAALDPPANPAALWVAKGAQGQDWESFNSFAYAADLVIPIVDISQTTAWAPSNTRGFWGYHLWWSQWLFTLAGWLVTALGAAAITGIIRRD